MAFEKLLTNTVSLLKSDGQNVKDLKASIAGTSILIQRSDILIESGDFIQHQMSNGATDTYEVIDPGFMEKFHSIPAGYQMEVRKLGIPEAKAAVQNITYNLSGPNSRVTQNSTDNSVNIVQMSPELQGHVEALREEIKTAKLPEGDSASASQIIDSLESQLNQHQPSGAVVNALLSALPNVGSVASIASLIIAALGG